jgi:hypothetical protein
MDSHHVGLESPNLQTKWTARRIEVVVQARSENSLFLKEVSHSVLRLSMVVQDPCTLFCFTQSLPGSLSISSKNYPP